ncbi:peptidyl-prolyl cis-transisomerase [Thecamonas trahens ATCC 50062]|uniref:Peptidyl-prolyl cis-transisomerase n=1 Tax=Thecamonas trahens ATCC 50062 TaxID=461836 RepID=A0A0L0DQ96_THETB|nr:peptidyl-prolyl cis-transisomerase [Thecamonas trahens ATCC 50062]KNC54196.1 peptidyl-prolyl cis-transisomerase [Thecamonas trahens ATCC 50062]|eukprot:XP_013753837.1 peptidyl-prolyl cis-transisomerase [Thecamonas trahens ATCC 50062]
MAHGYLRNSKLCCAGVGTDATGAGGAAVAAAVEAAVAPPPPPPSLSLITRKGMVVISLRKRAAPKTVAKIVAFTIGSPEAEAGTMPPCAALPAEDAPQATADAGCNFYRAEAVPGNWSMGEAFDPDGFYGPPYALLQGRFATDAAPGDWELPREDAPLVVRGDVCLIGSGPHFFIALAPHPEWGAGHTVFGRVADAESMRVVDALAREPTFHEQWGETAVTPLVTKLPFAVGYVEAPLPPIITDV